ncbi:MAG: response regulator, partial [Candidatus Methanofastidiosia archaeon]
MQNLSEPEPKLKQKERVALVIDDSPSVRDILKLHLKNLGFRKVYEASSGYDGIKIFQKENPDLVFLDMKMPRMNGLETLKIILSLNPKAKVILITAFEKSDSEVSDAIALGASDYLEKPIRRKKLLRIVENLSREDNGWEGPTSIDHALSKIERIQEASGEEE